MCGYLDQKLQTVSSGANFMGHGGARAPHFYKWLGTGVHCE